MSGFLCSTNVGGRDSAYWVGLGADKLVFPLIQVNGVIRETIFFL